MEQVSVLNEDQAQPSDEAQGPQGWMWTREPHPRVIAALDRFLSTADSEALSPHDWLRFYEFVVTSFRVEEGQRYSVSQLAERLRDAAFSRPGSIAIVYVHGLYILARYHDLPIYKDGFNP